MVVDGFVEMDGVEDDGRFSCDVETVAGEMVACRIGCGTVG